MTSKRNLRQAITDASEAIRRGDDAANFLDQTPYKTHRKCPSPTASAGRKSKVVVYAVVAFGLSTYLSDSMSEWDRGQMDYEEGQDTDGEVLGLYMNLKDANNRVRLDKACEGRAGI